MVFLLILCGCYNMPPADSHFTKIESAPAISAGKIPVYFYRRAKITGIAGSFYVYDYNEIIGALKADGYFIYQAEPGKHFFWVEETGLSTVWIDCELGKSYYIEGNSFYSGLAVVPQLSLMPPVVAKERIQGLNYYSFNK